MCIRINGIVHRVLFHIINCGNENIILGDPWLKKVNHLIDWEQQTLKIPESTDKTHDLNHQIIKVQGINLDRAPHWCLLPQDFIREKPAYPDENFINYIQGEKHDTTPRFKKTNGKFKHVPIGKISITTELARDTKTEEITLPEKYQEFTLVFSEEATH